MSMPDISKGKSLAKRAKPTFLEVGKRQIISSGRWNNDLMADYVILRGRDKWLKIGDLARVAYGAQMPKTKAQVRKRQSTLSRTLLDRGLLMLVDRSGPHGRVVAVKLYIGDSELEQQNMEQQLEGMRRRHEYTAEQYDRARDLLTVRHK